MIKKDAFMKKEMQLQNQYLTFIHKNKSLLSPTSILSHSPVAHKITPSLRNLTCTEDVDFGKRQDSYGRLSYSKKAPTTWMLNLKSSRETITEIFAWCKIAE